MLSNLPIKGENATFHDRVLRADFGVIYNKLKVIPWGSGSQTFFSKDFVAFSSANSGYFFKIYIYGTVVLDDSMSGVKLLGKS